MSHLTYAQFNAAKIHCEETVKRVLSRLEGYSFRQDVKEKIIKDYSLDTVQNELSQIGFSDSYATLDKINRIAQRVNSFLSEVETYAVYNFDLNISDYNKAITESAELLASSTDTAINAALETTDDELLRTYIRAVAEKEKYWTTDALLKAATERMKESRTYQKRAAENARLILAKKGIDVSDIADDAPVVQLIQEKNQELHDNAVDTAIRNRVLTSIIKIIKEQGFIVKKENVEECGDHAKISAIKANGEKADFIVHMDGKFVYKFHDYEGLSCEKDIGSFEEKFESIYGIKLEEKQIMWSNPDRVGKMAHQTMATQKIGG
jgi:hypothetical protein